MEVEDDYTHHDGPHDDGYPDQAEELALMQTGRGGTRGKPTANEEAWRPLKPQERQRITAIVKAPLEFQPDAGPSSTLLAYVGSPRLYVDASRKPGRLRHGHFTGGTATCTAEVAVDTTTETCAGGS